MITITTRRVLDEFQRRNVPVEIITELPYVLMRYLYNGKWHLLHSTMSEYTAGSAKIICDQKYISNELAMRNSIPVPQTVHYSQTNGGVSAEVTAFLSSQPPFVVKPADGAHGRGISVGVTANNLLAAVELASKTAGAGGVLLQQLAKGSDLRILVIGGQFVAAARRIPASVVGDGTKTLRQLIEHENETNPERGYNDEKRFSKIDMVAATRFLGTALDNQVPLAGNWVTVVGTANIGAGGYAIDYTDKVSEGLKSDAEKFARLALVATCGVDFIWDEASGEYYFIEANACPGFNLHIQPTEGQSQPVARHFVAFLLAQHGTIWRPFAIGDSPAPDQADTTS